jgi:hypothetical protein
MDQKGHVADWPDQLQTPCGSFNLNLKVSIHDPSNQAAKNVFATKYLKEYESRSNVVLNCVLPRLALRHLVELAFSKHFENIHHAVLCPPLPCSRQSKRRAERKRRVCIYSSVVTISNIFVCRSYKRGES